MSNKDISSDIFLSLEEIYSLEDYNDIQLFDTCLQNQNNLIINTSNSSFYIRVMFQVNNIPKEHIMRKNNSKKGYTIMKIFYNDKFMKVLVKNKENYNPSEILNKINSINDIKGYIRT